MLCEFGETWVSPTEAGRIAKVSRSSILAALKRGELKGFCAVCHGGLPLTSPRPVHGCPRGKKVGRRVRVVLRGADAARYSALPWAQAAGMASARARAWARGRERRQAAGRAAARVRAEKRRSMAPVSADA